jgi:Nuclear protein Es2
MESHFVVLLTAFEGAAATPEEKVQLAGKGREIVHRNTRFVENPFNVDKNKESLTQAASAQARVQPGRIGPDGKEILPAQSPKVGGFGFVATPSPAPGKSVCSLYFDRSAVRENTRNFFQFHV